MKPDGSALDIVVIGLGQAGGNIATEFYRRGYSAMALNTAQTDLDALDPGGVYPALPLERRLYVGLDGYDGAGMDPRYGAECIRAHADQIRSAVLREAEAADVVLLAAGLGGGTGSSIAELVALLKEQDLPLIALLTLPTDGESGIIKVNAVRAINQIINLPLSGFLFVDNQRITSLNQDISIIDYYAHINGRIASPIDGLNRLNERDDLIAIRSFDGEDLRKLMLSGGIMNYGVVELPNITVEEVLGAVKDSLDAGDLMPSGFDVASASYVGVVIEAPEAVLAATPIATFEEIDERLKTETQGAAIYRGLYRSSQSGPTVLRLWIATQALPERIQELLGQAQREGQRIQEKLSLSLPSLELGDVGSVELFRPNARTRPGERGSRRNRRSTPLPPPSAEDVSLADNRFAKKKATREESLVGGEAEVRRKLAPKPTAPPTPAAGPPPRSRPKASSRPEPAAPADKKRDAERALLGAAATPDDEGPSDDETADAFDLPRSRSQTVSSAIPDLPEPGQALPGPELYDRLVAEFLHGEDDEERRRISDRLETDAASDLTVIRYYATEAMAKLGAEHFGEALERAASDSNEAVRNLAAEALREA